MDFLKIRARNTKGGIDIYPDFIVGNHKDFMTRGHSFYAIFDYETGMWSTDETMVQKIVDQELYSYYQKKQSEFEGMITVQYMANFSSNSWSRYKKYLKETIDNYVILDQTLTFQNQKCSMNDYRSKRLPYSLEKGNHSAWDELVGTLYSDEEREKIEWAIGSIFAGESKKISKFFVLYGAPGSGKGTILDIITKLFNGYYSIIESRALGSRTSEFGTAAFKDNPLVAIEYDSDLSRIENNTRLNSIISHETIPVRELYKAAYNVRINSLIFLATNSPVQITDSKSGIIRRLIDINPSGLKIPSKQYVKLVERINFELGSIAQHCLDVYKKLGLHYYDAYRSTDMMERTDIFFNFVEESYFAFKEEDGVTLKRAWAMFKEYAEESGLSYLMPKHKFKQELKEYFDRLILDTTLPDGTRVKNFYKGFLSWKVDGKKDITVLVGDDDSNFEIPPWLQLNEEAALNSILDNELRDCPAQYANEQGTPFIKWENVNGTLKMINSHFLHYVLMPENHIVIDFDIKDPETGEKSAILNLEAASHWPPTYAEFSKSGAGLHLHYIYDGDVDTLQAVYSNDVEIKVFKGKSSLRRQLTRCNKIPIKKISSGLPLKEGKKMINHEAVKTEQKLRELISRCMEKEFGATKPSVDFINHLLVEAKESGLSYDVSDMKQAIMIFAMNSTNQSEYCMKLASEMPYKSEDHSTSSSERYSDDRIVFFDCEVFPNLFLINWKYDGSDSCVRMINPTPEEVGELFNYKLVGFNNRRYDNHILYARYIGYNLEEIYKLSQNIVNSRKNGNNYMFGEAYNISYTDVYDFASAGHKMSLKKWEIKLGLHHQELGLPWDEPVDESKWSLVAEYCDNDVISTEAVFHHLSGDFRAREILADIAGMSVNDSTNALTTRIIFGNNKKPKLNWYDLSEEFPGYSYKNGKNYYRGDDIGRGGWVYANPGMYGYCKTFDVASMHPRSIIMERYLGEYTDRFEDIVNIRLYIKHGDYDSVGKLFDGKLKRYLNNHDEAKDLSNALKTAINSVYGMTSATYDNPFRDRRNKNNIVALRGALFMRTLQDEVESRGFKVVHIKTDSIKVADPTPEIETFIYEFGHKYGYEFEVEAEWEKICLVNDAVFVGKQTVNSPQAPGKWTATGKQFQEPYVFKKLFTHEDIIFDDLCLTMTTNTAFYLNMNENSDTDNMIFVGRAGAFCPIKPGCGGGLLMRIESDGRYSFASGTKGFRFLEAESVMDLEFDKYIDESYFEVLADKAIDAISKYGDFYWFVSNNSDIPWLMPCGDTTVESCISCKHFQKNHDLCDLNFDISEILLKK